jgi:hypothetical protein
MRSYEVVAQIDAGGIGEVRKARSPAVQCERFKAKENEESARA